MLLIVYFIKVILPGWKHYILNICLSFHLRLLIGGLEICQRINLQLLIDCNQSNSLFVELKVHWDQSFLTKSYSRVTSLKLDAFIVHCFLQCLLKITLICLSLTHWSLDAKPAQKAPLTNTQCKSTCWRTVSSFQRTTIIYKENQLFINSKLLSVYQLNEYMIFFCNTVEVFTFQITYKFWK